MVPTAENTIGFVKTDNQGNIATKLLPNGQILVAGLIQNTPYSPNTGFIYNFGLMRYNADGTIDNSYGNNGIVSLDNTRLLDAGNFIFESDGKVIITASISTNGALTNHVLRYNSDGSLDTTFGTNGQISIPYFHAGTLSKQLDGKLLHLLGNTITRYNQDGSIDNQFGDQGTALISSPNFGRGDGILNEFSTSFDSINDIVVQSDGKVLTVGQINTESYELGYKLDFSIRRFNADGSVDSEFGDNGLVITDFTTGTFKSSDEAINISLMSNGQFIVAGREGEIAKYNSDGSLDTRFGINGKIILNLLTNEEFYSATTHTRAIDVTEEGKILVTGQFNEDIFLARLNNNGTIDKTFAKNGFIINKINDSFHEEAYQVISLPDKTVMVIANDSYDSYLIKYLNNGQLDSTWGAKNNLTQLIDHTFDTNTIEVQPSLIANIDEQTTYQNGIYHYQFKPLNTDLDLNYQVELAGDSELPDWLSFDPESLVLTGSPDFAGSEQLQLYLIATDESTNRLFQTFNININSTPSSPSTHATNVSNLANMQAGFEKLKSFSLDTISKYFFEFYYDAYSNSYIDKTLTTTENSAIKGTINQADHFEFFGVNLLGDPSTLTQFNYLSNQINISASGSLHYANDNGNIPTGGMTNVMITDSSGSSASTYYLQGSLGTTKGTINRIEISTTNYQFTLGGSFNIKQDDNSISPTVVSNLDGIIDYIKIINGDEFSEFSNLNLDLNTFNSFSEYNVLLEQNLNGFNNILGTNSNDALLMGGAFDDMIDGADGIDTAVFNINSTDIGSFRKSKYYDYVITSSEGVDTLINIEKLSFNDGIFDVQDILSLQEPTQFFVNQDGIAIDITPENYNGAVKFLEYSFLGSDQSNIVTGGNGNDFINLLGGDDAANGGAGDDVLDGGTGSNFLTGGGNDDTFFLDGRNNATTWSTITDFENDEVNIWGWVEGTSQLLTTEASNGADGFKGLTFHYDLNRDNSIDTSITFTGLTESDINNISENSIEGNGYLKII